MASCAVAKPPRMTPDEKRLVREMHFDRHMKPADIARTVGRDLSCVVRLLKQTRVPNRIGRPAALSEAQIDKVVKELERMVDKADACEEITVTMLLRRCRIKACERVLSNALHSRGYWFRALRKKMILTPADVAARFAWARKYKNKTRECRILRCGVWSGTRTERIGVGPDCTSSVEMCLGAGGCNCATLAARALVQLLLLVPH